MKRASSAWLATIGAALVLAFAGIAWVQMRQVAVLSTAVHYEGDNVLWAYFQLEAEFLRLRDQLRDARRKPDDTAAEALRLQFEIFASRLPLLSAARTEAVFGPGATNAADAILLADLQAFVTEADPWLAEFAALPLAQAPLARLVQRMDGQAAAVHDLILRINQRNGELVAARNEVSGTLSRQGIGLTVFQSLLTLAFVALAWRQMQVLTRRRREQEDLARHLDAARADAEAASAAKTSFLANMSHELRTPFNGLLGMLTLLEVSPLDAEQSDHLRTARQSATHLLHLLNDILDLTKLESGQLSLQPEPTDLRRVLGDARDLMLLTSEAKGLDLRLELATELPDAVLADEMRLRQIVLNLLNNAIKFTDRGQVQLRAAWREEQLVIQVLDTGIGMDAATLGRLFQRFMQGDNGTAKRFGGSGLGLEISRNLARMMGGDITAQSQPLQGSCFTVELPLPRCAMPASTVADTTADTGGRALEVLVVDDQAVNRKLMQRLLARMGHRVRLAAEGAQALEAVRQQKPDLVLMDLHMPVLDGLQATQAIRALPAPAASVPVVALTADAFRETRERLLAGGMDGFLAKPVQLPELQALLARHGGLTQLQAAPAPDKAPAPAAAAPRRRRRFRPGEVGEVLDLQVMGELMLGLSVGGCRQLLQPFLADETGGLQALRQALLSGQTAVLAERAHAVKGAAGSLGLKALQALAAEVEAAGADADPGTCTLQADRLAQTWAQSRALCEQMGLA